MGLKFFIMKALFFFFTLIVTLQIFSSCDFGTPYGTMTQGIVVGNPIWKYQIPVDTTKNGDGIADLCFYNSDTTFVFLDGDTVIAEYLGGNRWVLRSKK